MWYVIQVAGGQEEETAALIQRQISPEVMRESFIPRKEKVKKFRGYWRQVEEILFPGYVFTETEYPEALFLELKRITRLTKLLQDGTAFFIPLSREEEEFIRSIGDDNHVTRVSRIRIEKSVEGNVAEAPGIATTGTGTRKAVASSGLVNKKEKTDDTIGRNIVVLNGPLKGHEGCVVRYNLHKREVTVRLPFMGRETEVRMGIEIVEEKVDRECIRK